MSPAPDSASGARIVLIDDDAVVRAALEHHLAGAGHRVVSAADGAAGVTLARLARPDVILLDLELPDIHGFEVLDRLRTEPSLQATPVVVLTSSADDETIAAALMRGAQDFVVKSPNWPVLDARLRVAIRLKRLQDDLREVNDDLARLARTDPLTGVANRRFGESLLADHGRGARGLTVLKVDVDRFKSVNDRFGHAAGDRALRVVATAMQEALREGDRVVRWGGDEFIAVLPQVSDDEARVVADRLQAAVVRAPELADIGGITISVGVAHGTDPIDTLARADTAMYEAKLHRPDRPALHEALAELLSEDDRVEHQDGPVHGGRPRADDPELLPLRGGAEGAGRDPDDA